jgi:hypothetical protein
MWEKQQITTLLCVLRGMQGRFILKFEIFYSGSEVPVAHSKVTVTPQFFVILPWPLRNLVATAVDRMAHDEHHCT